MNEVINIIPGLIRLGIAMLINIALGTFYNVRIQELKFNKDKMIDGIVKALIIAFTFVGLSYCFGAADLSIIGVEVEAPSVIMGTALALYVGKDIVALKNILGIGTNFIRKEGE